MYYKKEDIYKNLKEYLKVEKGDKVPLNDFIRAVRMTTTIRKIATVREWYDYFRDLGYLKSTYMKNGYDDTMVIFLK